MPDAVTLPQHFMAGGYQVVGGGKIFHNSYNDPPSWQEYFRTPELPLARRTDRSTASRSTSHFDWGPVQAGDEEMGDFQVVRWAEEFLGQVARPPLLPGRRH